MRIGIAFKLNVVVLLVVLALGGALGTLFAVQQVGAMRRELDRSVELCGEHVATGVGHALVARDVRALGSTLQATSVHSDITYVVVESADGGVRAARWVAEPRGRVAEYAFPLRESRSGDVSIASLIRSSHEPDGEIVGRMALGVDLAAYEAARRRLLARTGSGVLVAGLLAALLGWAILQLVLRRSVTPLVEGIRAIGTGQLGRRVDLRNRDDEMSDIGRAFNDMAERLSTTLVSKQELEATVTLRTAELSDALAERIRAQQALAERAERERLILDSTAEAIFGVDPGQNFTFCNAACLRMLRYDGPEQLVGKNMHDVLHRSGEGKPIPREECRLDRKISDVKGTHLVDELFWRSDGTSFPVECWAHPIVRGGVRLGGVVTFVDLTERKKLESELLNMRKLESLGVLAGGIAHDFNNMLSGIVGSVSLAKEVLDGPPEARELLEEAEAAVLRTKGLTRQLLTFARGGEPVKKVLDLRSVVEEATRFALSGSAVKAEYAIPDGLWHVEADAGQIAQVVQNLAINAVQAMGQGGIISVSCENAEVCQDPGQCDPALCEAAVVPLPPGRYVKFSVADRGIGIAPEHMPRIFDPYFTTKQGGSGLGLATVYSVVKSHHGHVACTSEPGKGSTFHVWLPATERAAAPASPAGPVRAVPGGRRVLVMDDDAGVRRVATRMLTMLGYEVVSVADGREAVSAWRDAKQAGDPFDLVLVDLTVPGGMGGAETLVRLREIDRGVRVIVSSGYSSDPTMSRYRELGFVGIVAKPYTVAELSRAVAEALAA